MNATCEIRQDKGVIRIEGSLNASTVDAVREQCHTWLDEHGSVTHWVLDASVIEFIDSAGLGVLISLLKKLAHRGGDLSIAALQKQTRVVFEITRSYKLFHLYESVEEALRAES